MVGATYLAVIAAVTAALWGARQWALATLASPQAREQWQRDVEQLQNEPGPVQRKKSTAVEPPALILLRDHFAAILAGCLVIATFVFGFLAVTIRGAFFQSAAGARGVPPDGTG